MIALGALVGDALHVARNYAPKLWRSDHRQKSGACTELFKLFKQSSRRDSQSVARERFKLFKQSSPRDSQFTGDRKAACRDRAGLGCRRVLVALERGVSNTLLGDQRVLGDQLGRCMQKYALN